MANFSGIGTVVIGVAIAAIVILLCSTPTVNYDDLLYLERFHRGVFTPDNTRFLLVYDLAIDFRTFVLSRLTQGALIGLFGIAPFPHYALMITLHAVGAYLVFRLGRFAFATGPTPMLMALAWFASPTILPGIMVLHHYLYLVVPYIVLLGWCVFALKRERASAAYVIAGSSILVCSWLFGESAVASIAAACIFISLWKLKTQGAMIAGATFLQGIISGSCLLAFLAVQQFVIADPSGQRRFQTDTGLGTAQVADRLFIFATQVLDALKARLGLAYTEPELQAAIPGFGLLDDWRVWLILPIITLALWLTTERRADAEQGFPIKGLLLSITAASLLVYAVLSAMTGAAMAVRYSAVFWCFAGVSFVLLAGKVFRLAQPVVVAVLLTLTIGGLLKAEWVVNARTRSILSSIQLQVDQGRNAIVLHNSAVQASPEGVSHILTPGAGSQYFSALIDPMAAAWTTAPALIFYANASFVGLHCESLRNGTIRLARDRSTRTVLAGQIHAVGLTSPVYPTSDRTIRDLAIEDACQ